MNGCVVSDIHLPGFIWRNLHFLSLTPEATNISAFLLASSGVILAVGTDSN
jgi:hypothetical protein